MVNPLFVLGGFVVLTGVLALYNTPIVDASKMVIEQKNQDSGWIEYSDTVYNDTNRITIGTTPVNFSMSNYTVRQAELPVGVTNTTWFNGSHLLTDISGSAYLYRWRYNAEPKIPSPYCELKYNIGGGVGELPARFLSFPKGINVEVIGTFTGLEYTLDTWKDNGAVITIECNGNVEFWDIELTIARVHKGVGVYG